MSGPAGQVSTVRRWAPVASEDGTGAAGTVELSSQITLRGGPPVRRQR